MNEKLTEIQILAMALSDTIRKKHIKCKIYRNNCCLCEFFQSGKCEMNEVRDTLNNKIKEISEGVKKFE